MDFVKIYIAVVSLSYGSVYMYVFYINPLYNLNLQGEGCCRYISVVIYFVIYLVCELHVDNKSSIETDLT